jgi:hypothetical protein
MEHRRRGAEKQNDPKRVNARIGSVMFHAKARLHGVKIREQATSEM